MAFRNFPEPNPAVRLFLTVCCCRAFFHIYLITNLILSQSFKLHFIIMRSILLLQCKYTVTSTVYVSLALFPKNSLHLIKPFDFTVLIVDPFSESSISVIVPVYRTVCHRQFIRCTYTLSLSSN